MSQSITPKTPSVATDSKQSADEDQLRKYGYEQVLHRTWGPFTNFCASFCALYFVGGVRYLFAVGISAGGAPALWSSWIITGVCSSITAAVLAELCSAIPLSGSIYIWAAESAGPRWGRLAGFVTAFWTVTAWTSFLASTCQSVMYYILSEAVVYNVPFPGGAIDADNVKFRAITWAGSEVILAICVALCCMPPRYFKFLFWFTAAIMMLDFVMTFIWLPIGVARTYGFQKREFFTETYNGTGAPTGWNWLLSFFFTSGVLTGFDASGHVAEETRNAGIQAARGLFWSCVVSAILATPIIFLFIACSPPLDELFSYDAPQPFVILYKKALGDAGQIIMTVIAILGLWLNVCVAIVAASRLAFAIARDGVLPGSSWIGAVDESRSPRNAVLFIGMIAGFLLCFILPSNVAFTSLVSAGGIPTIAAYALISFLRLTLTRGQFRDGKWSLGRLSAPFAAIALVWNLFILAVLTSPYYFPVSADTLNWAPVLLGAVTIMGLVAYMIIPESRWLNSRHLRVQARKAAESE